MKDSRRNALIGAFVVGALIISAIGIAVFFGGNLGIGKIRALMVFRGNVTGLDTGTQVQFRGMKIGEVKRIRTIYDPTTKQVLFPVYAEFTATIEVPGGGSSRKTGAGVRQAWIADMVDQGLRAQLQTKSFVTGQQMIMLDFVGHEPPEFTRIEPDVLEIPTARSPNEELIETIKELPVRDLMVDGHRLLANLNALMEDKGDQAAPLPALLAELAGLSKTLASTSSRLGDEYGALARDSRRTIDIARTTLASIEATSGSLRVQVERGASALDGTAGEVQTLSKELRTLTAGLDALVSKVDGSIVRFDQTVRRADFLISEDSALGAGLTQALREVTAAAQSLRRVTDDIHRRPESLLFGRRQDAR